MTTITRRQALSGLGTIAASTSALAASAPALAETPSDRVERLSRELAQALTEWTGGQFKAEVYPSNHPSMSTVFSNCVLSPASVRDYAECVSASERFQHHAGMALMSLDELPGRVKTQGWGWWLSGTPGRGFVMLKEAV